MAIQQLSKGYLGRPLPGVITVKHNIETAHRLSLLPGKCEAIHGHSMWINLCIHGQINPKTGILENLHTGDAYDFGGVKKEFRSYLDTEYDHRLLLNKDDPWAQAVYFNQNSDDGAEFIPGLNPTPGDPTTENIALWVADYMSAKLLTVVEVEVWETSVNMASATSLVGLDRV